MMTQTALAEVVLETRRTIKYSDMDAQGIADANATIDILVSELKRKLKARNSRFRESRFDSYIASRL